MRKPISNIPKLIDELNTLSIIDKWQHPQIEIEDVSKNADFLLYLDSICEYRFIDTMGSNLRRIKCDLKLNEIIHKADTAIACGFKVVKVPISKFTEWDLWEGGFIEGYSRMDGFGEYPEFFTWFYIRMEKLEEILTKWKNELYTY